MSLTITPPPVSVGIAAQTTVDPDFQIAAFGEKIITSIKPLVQASFTYTLNAQNVTDESSGSGSTAVASSMLEAHSGAATSSVGRGRSRRIAKYDAGQGSDFRFTAVFDTPASGNNQYAGAFDVDNGVMFGYQGTTFGIFRRSATVDTFVPQASWNVDPMDGTGPSGDTLDQQTGNVYRIQMQYLGFGEIQFYIERNDTGAFYLVHRIKYANLNTAPSFDNPSFPLAIESNNTSNATDVVVKCASWFAGQQGVSGGLLGPRFTTDNTKTGVGTTLTNIFALRVKSTFNGKNNKGLLLPILFSAGVDGTKPAIIRVVLNPTLGGSPSYADINASQSFTEKDTAGTTVTGGTALIVRSVAKDRGFSLNLNELNARVFPGDVVSFAARATAATTDATLSLLWIEDQ